jgi:hypothetical protein
VAVWRSAASFGTPPHRAHGRTLIENNVIFANGAVGIQTFSSRHIDVVNNTTYQNGTVLTESGEAAAPMADDLTFYNNVFVAASGRPTSTGGNGSVTWDYNVQYGGSDSAFTGAHDLTSDPKFVNAGCDDFRLATGSPAIGSGTAGHASAVDILGAARPAGAVDRGAYQTP